MNRGINLTSQDVLENAVAKSSMLYVVALAAGVILGIMSGEIVFSTVIFLAVALILQTEYLKWKIRDFRDVEFWKPEGLTQEEILQKTSRILGEQGILVVLENDELVFKHNSIYYYYENVGECLFRLNWRFTLGKALLTFTYISNYKTVRKDMTNIAFTIQNSCAGNQNDK